MSRNDLHVVTIAAAFAAAMVFSACADRADPAVNQRPTSYRRAWSDEDVVRPDWIANPTRNGSVIAAWGSTPNDPFIGRGEMRNKALSQARHELGRMVMVRVQSVLKDYVGDSGGSVTSFSESVSQTIAVQSVRSSYQQDEWVHPKTSELFLWAVVDPRFQDKLATAVAASASADPTADTQARAKLESDKGFAELDRLLDASFQKP